MFSREPSDPKSPSKIFILSSSFASLAQHDVDTLFSAVGKSLPVITPVNALVENAMRHRQDGCTVGLWADSDVLASGVYADAFHRASDGLQTVDYVGFSPDSTEDVLEGLTEFLDMYILSGAQYPLSVLLYDDFSASWNTQECRKAVETILSDDEYAHYRKFLSDGFAVVDAMSAIAASCYRLMREKDMFTHRISYPETTEYTLVASDGGEYPFKYVELTAGYVR